MLITKAPAASPPYLPHTAFNYFAYYCVLSDKNKAELIIHPEMRTLNCSLQGPLRGLCIYYKMQTEERRKGTEVSESPEKAEFCINSFKLSSSMSCFTYPYSTSSENPGTRTPHKLTFILSVSPSAPSLHLPTCCLPSWTTELHLVLFYFNVNKWPWPL